MIVGLGIDVAEVGRIQAVIEAQRERFLRRVYTLDEVAYCEQFKNKYERYAGRFAVKEAAMKALSEPVGTLDADVVSADARVAPITKPESSTGKYPFGVLIYSVTVSAMVAKNTTRVRNGKPSTACRVRA